MENNKNDKNDIKMVDNQYEQGLKDFDLDGVYEDNQFDGDGIVWK
tara:strand:- start:330 stop:464 length:135 start_codon:yes stop_codon:yes gene_type:complete